MSDESGSPVSFSPFIERYRFEVQRDMWLANHEIFFLLCSVYLQAREKRLIFTKKLKKKSDAFP